MNLKKPFYTSSCDWVMMTMMIKIKTYPGNAITCYAKDPLQSHSQMTHLDSSSMSPTTSAGSRNRPLLPHFEHLLASLQVRKLIFILIPLTGWIMTDSLLFLIHSHFFCFVINIFHTKPIHFSPETETLLIPFRMVLRLEVFLFVFVVFVTHFLIPELGHRRQSSKLCILESTLSIYMYFFISVICISRFKSSLSLALCGVEKNEAARLE